MGIASRIVSACLLALVACDALAGQLLVAVADDGGKPVADAVVTVRPLVGQAQAVAARRSVGLALVAVGGGEVVVIHHGAVPWADVQ